MRTASDSGGMMTSVRLWALPTNARPNPRRTGSTSLGTSDSAAGSVAAMPMPWKIASDDERPHGPAGLDAGQQQDGAAGEVGEPAAHECAQATDPIDEHPCHERGRDLDERSDPDDDADLGVRHARPVPARRAATP